MNKILSFFALAIFSCTSSKNLSNSDYPNSHDGSACEELTIDEAKLLTSEFEKAGRPFDFTNRKVVFVTGSAGSRIITKEDFYNDFLNPMVSKGSTPVMSIVMLNDTEKTRTGGCDAMVLIWVKFQSDRQKRKIIEKISLN